MSSFKQLVVWQKSVQLVLDIYLITSAMPKTEQFGLVSQMRRSAVSIPSNIAEGQKRNTKKDFSQFLRIASGSAAELETQIIISEKLFAQLDFSKIKTVLEEIQKMLSTLISRFQA